MRILLSYPGHRFSTFDVAAGYEKAFVALGHKVDVFNYHIRIDTIAKMLIAYDEKVKSERRRSNPMATSGRISVLASEGIVLQAVEFVPDVVILVNGMQLHRHAFDLLHNLSLPVVMLLTESPYLDHDQAVISTKGHADLIFTNDAYSVKPLAEMTGLPVTYLPHSYDPEIHRPRPALKNNGYYSSDVFFHGTLFADRVTTLMPLAELVDDYVVEIGGVNPDWSDDSDIGDMIPNNELARYYAGTKVAINHHRTVIGANGDELEHITNGDAYSIGPRAYEIAACGAFQLCDDTRPELVEVFGDSVATYSNPKDLLDKTKYYLKNEGERLDMAAAAFEKVAACTFEQRARDIVIPTITEVL